MIELEARPTNSGISPFSLEARDEDYDTYLFWPSLSNGMGGIKESFVTTNHGVIVLTFNSLENSPPRLLAYVP
jgi:hypothetical protein